MHLESFESKEKKKIYMFINPAGHPAAASVWSVQALGDVDS